jgi:chaperonin GroEL
VITVEEAKGMETSLKAMSGDAVRSGIPSPYSSRILRGWRVHPGQLCSLIHEKKISSMKDLLPLLEQVAKMGRPRSSCRGSKRAKRSPRWS